MSINDSEVSAPRDYAIINYLQTMTNSYKNRRNSEIASEVFTSLRPAPITLMKL